MKEIKAESNYLRISPRKVRLLADLIRGEPASAAQNILRAAPRSGRSEIQKLLKSALANAKHNYGMDTEKLLIKEIRVDQGPTLKRWMPRAFGRAFPIRKRSSHITLVLTDEKSKIKGQKSK